MNYRPKISKEALQRILNYRQREAVKDKRKFDALLRTSKVTSWVILVINIFLLVDVHLLSHPKIYDTITDSHLQYTRGKYSRSRVTGFRIVTQKNGWGWEVRNTGYETAGTRICYYKTPLFKIVYKIKNLDAGYHLTRDYDAIRIAKYASIILLIVGIVGIVWKQFHELGYGLLAVVQIGVAIFEGFLLIF